MTPPPTIASAIAPPPGPGHTPGERALPLHVITAPAPDRSAAPPPAPAHVQAARRMIDSHGRTIRDLRLSIIDRCNFRCVYCMDPDVRFMPAHERLTVDELVRVARVCVSLGVEKIRITGGEPTVHPELLPIIAGLASLPIKDLAMTTNGSVVDNHIAAAWRRAGLSRLTISLDARSEIVFAAIARAKGSVARVVESVVAAQRVGLGPIKLNAVLIRGVNEGETLGLARLARELGVEMRFIEFMPLDSGDRWDRAHVVPSAETLATIQSRYALEPVDRDDPSRTADTFRFQDGAPGLIGVISPVSAPFCGACSRLRITCDGKALPCLFSREGWGFRELMRGGADDESLAAFLIDATWTKQAGHGMSDVGFTRPERGMWEMGG